MQQRTLVQGGPSLSILGFGCAPVGSRASGGESRGAIARALDAGITYFDTADMYGLGASERIVAECVRGRQGIVVSTKCGYTFSNKLRAVSFIKPLLRPLVRRLKGVKASAGAVMASQRSQRFDAEYIRACADASLQRLGGERLDVYFLHDPPMDVVQRGEALGVLLDLHAKGKVGLAGLSAEPDVVAAALARPGPNFRVVQVAASPLEPAGLTSVLPLAQRAGVGVIARQPFANGRLVSDPRLLGALKLRGLATDPASVAGLALRYLRAFPGVSSILPSMIKPEHLAGNARAVAGAELTPAEIAALVEIGAPAPPGTAGSNA